MRFASLINALHRQLLRRMHRHEVSMSGHGPIISFTFDDFPRSAASRGGTILEDYGARGTYYAALELRDRCGDLGELFHESDLEKLLEKGHEVASHTFSHISARVVPRDEFLADANRGRQALEECSGSECGNFAYPFGDVALPVKAVLGPRMTSSRGIIPGINGPDDVDLNLLLANSLYGDMETLASAEAMIAENMQRKGWLIFYTHDVQAQPSPYGCTPTLFEAVVANAAASGSQILTVQQTLEKIRVPNGQAVRRAARSVLA